MRKTEPPVAGGGHVARNVSALVELRVALGVVVNRKLNFVPKRKRK